MHTNSQTAAVGRDKILCILPPVLTEDVKPEIFFLFSRDINLTIKNYLYITTTIKPIVVHTTVAIN